MANLFTVCSDGSVKGQLSCTDCELSKGSCKTNNMKGTGPVGADFMVLGQWVGSEDDAIGKPHTGKNGRMFRDFCEAAGLDVNRLYLSNLIRCRPDEEAKDAHFKKCQRHLLADISRIKPKAIISLGAKALYWLTGRSGVKQFRRCGIPCELAPDVYVYPFQQPMAIIHAETAEMGDKIRTEIIDDLLWLKKKADEGSLDRPDDVQCDYKLAETIEDVLAFLTEFENVEDICVDFETADKDLEPTFRPLLTSHISMVTLSKGIGHARAIPFKARGRQSMWWWADEILEVIRDLLRKFFGRQDKWFFGHHLKYDIKWCLHDFGVVPRWRYDTMYHHYLIDENLNRNLEELTIKYSKMAPWKPPNLSKLMKNTVKLAEYGCKDVDATCRVRAGMPYDDRQRWLMEELLCPLAKDYMLLEVNGIAIDQANLARYGNYLTELIDKHRKALKAIDVVKKYEVANNIEFNPDATAQVADIMENYCNLPKLEETKKSGRYSTANAVLEEYMDKHEFVEHMYFLRKLTKLKSSYHDVIVDYLQIEPLIHTSVRVDGTVTGRPSSKDPNAFVTPRPDTVEKTGITEPKIAKAVYATRDTATRCLLQADASQVELRMLACFSKDPSLIQIYRDGIDLHRATAAKVFEVTLEEVTEGQRSQAKAVNFGVVYGQGERGLGDGFVTAARKKARKEKREFTAADEAAARKSASDFIRGHKDSFPKAWEWMSAQERQIKRYGYQETVFGRRRHYDRVGMRELRMGLNFPIQSGAADICSFSILWSNRALREQGLDALHVLSVYDSIVMDVSKDAVWETAETIKYVMEEMVPSVFSDIIIVPLKADFEIGSNLGNMVKVDVSTRSVAKK